MLISNSPPPVFVTYTGKIHPSDKPLPHPFPTDKPPCCPVFTNKVMHTRIRKDMYISATIAEPVDVNSEILITIQTAFRIFYKTRCRQFSF